MQTNISRFVRLRMTISPFPPVPDFGPKPEEQKDLAVLGEEAEKLLGYTYLKRKVDTMPYAVWEDNRFRMEYCWKEICKKIEAENNLAGVLSRLGVDIIDAESVSKYRDELLQKLTQPKKIGRFARLLNIIIGSPRSPKYVWHRESISNSEDIPTAVMIKTVAIKKNLQSAKFYIEYLALVQYLHNYFFGREIVSKKYVPKSFSFLVVDYDGKLYKSEKGYCNGQSNNDEYEHIQRYIDVW
jgi:hypothetical protein